MLNEIEIVVTGKDQSGPALQSARKNTDSLGSAAEAAGGLLDALGPVGAAAGAAIALAMAGAVKAVDFLADSLKTSLSRAADVSKLGAQLGLNPEQMKQLGEVAGQVYADGFGESFTNVTETLKSVQQNLKDFTNGSKEDLKGLAEATLTLSATLGEDADAITRAVSQMLRTGLAKTAQEAFDLLQKGAEEGVNKAGDILDTFNEYSTQFRKLGISGADAMGLMSQAIKAGARDSDIAADALKEFSIRAVDGSKTTSDGFKRLGLDASKMADDIAAGGPRAARALDTVLDKLRAIKDPTERARIAVELFGTQAEDLGAALYAMDLDTAAADLGDFAGAANKASNTLSSGLGPSIERIQRAWEDFKANLGEKIAPIVDKIIDAFEALGQHGKKVWDDLVKFLKPFVDEVLPKLRDTLNDVKQVWEDNRESIEKIEPILKPLALMIGTVLLGAIVAVVGWIEIFIDFLGYLGDMFEKTQKGVRNLTLIFLDLFEKVIDGAASAFGWIPGIGDEIKKAQNKFHEFADGVRKDLGAIPEKKMVTLQVSVSGLSQAANAIYDVANRSYHATITTGIIHRAAGGVTAIGQAATGGLRSGLVEVGEEGREVVRMPIGSMVYPKANANQMAANAARDHGMTVNLYVQGSIHSERDLVKIVRDEFKRGGFRGVVSAA